jgi:hypothetical protein
MKGYEYLVKFFKDEGFKYEEKDTWFAFKIQGKNYVAFKSESVFLQIVMICNTKDYSRSQLLDASNSLNQDKFVLKFTVSDDAETVWCSYEFEPNASTVSDDFMAAFAMLDKGTDELFEKLTK